MRLEHPRDAGRHDQRPGDLHEDGEPVRHVVAVISRREPGEVHPRPPDGEEHHRVTDQALDRVRLADGMVETGRSLCDRNDEHEIEEQLERRRRAMRLVRGAGAHRRVNRGAGDWTMVGRGVTVRHRSPILPNQVDIDALGRETRSVACSRQRLAIHISRASARPRAGVSSDGRASSSGTTFLRS